MMKFHSNALLILLIVCNILSSCNSTDINFRYQKADEIAKLNGFTKKLLKGGDFWITTYQRIDDKNSPYVFYIEGDGLFFIYRDQEADDPTPLHPMLFKLASMDSRRNVVYVARPCQYTPQDLNPLCNFTYWTDKRMSESAVSSINAVIETITNKKLFSLVGYSGGGGIAILVAARNKKVKDIVTIAGNLDIDTFSNYHNIKPMTGSLNPIDYAKQVTDIPQLHLSGDDDKVVPKLIVDTFVKACNSKCVHQKSYKNISHSKGWEGVWHDVLKTPLVCE